MARFVSEDPVLRKLFKAGRNWVPSPNTDKEGSAAASRASHHGDFDDDKATVKATLARILGQTELRGEAPQLRFVSSASSCRQARLRATAGSGAR
jgi:hypothetical protein